MRVVVFGAGAVGGLLAARLAAHGPAAGTEVVAAARGAQLAAMNQRGITLWIGEERTCARFTPPIGPRHWATRTWSWSR